MHSEPSPPDPQSGHQLVLGRPLEGYLEVRLLWTGGAGATALVQCSHTTATATTKRSAGIEGQHWRQDSCLSAAVVEGQRLVLHFINRTGVSLFVRGSLEIYRDPSSVAALTANDAGAHPVAQPLEPFVGPSNAAGIDATRQFQRLHGELLTEVDDASDVPEGHASVIKRLRISVSTGFCRGSYQQSKTMQWVFRNSRLVQPCESAPPVSIAESSPPQSPAGTPPVTELL